MADVRVTVEECAVRLWREGQALYVEPPCLEVLAPVLRTWARACAPAADGALRVGRRRERLFELETYGGQPVLRCWMGLAPAVLGALNLKGVRYRVRRGLNQAPLAVPPGGRAARTLVDRSVLQFVAAHDRGLVRYGHGQVQPALLAAQMARAWPTWTAFRPSSRPN
jgi:hypothetical protein